MYSFNLVSENWIPCLKIIDEQRRSITLSLQNTLLQAHQIESIVGDNPLVTVALHRLLLAILHRVLEGPCNTEHWAQLWRVGKSDEAAISGYLEKWKPRFDLFDEKLPFYQTSEVSPDKAGSSSKLLFQADNNATLFDHTFADNAPALSPAVAARLLLAFQAFDVSGTITGDSGNDSANASPLCQSAVALVRGQNLFQTLMLNLHQYNSEDEEPFSFDPQKDRPAWESVENTKPIERYPLGYLDLLTWQSRRFLLIPGRDAEGNIVVRSAVKMKGEQFPKGFSLQGKETMTAFRKKEKAKENESPYFTIGFNEGRVLWRDSHALFQSFSDQSRRPKMLTWLSDLATEDILRRSQMLPVDFLGISTDRAKPLFWRHERLPLPLEYLDAKELQEQLRKAISLAEETYQALRSSTYLLAKELIEYIAERQARSEDIRPVTQYLSSEAFYWSQLEAPFRRLLTDLPNDLSEDDEREIEYGRKQMPAWAHTLREVANEAFSVATRSLDGTSRSLKAVAVAERSFQVKLHGVLGSYLEEYRNAHTQNTGGN
jgi:CRISPR system Cascade subunit CasA